MIPSLLPAGSLAPFFSLSTVTSAANGPVLSRLCLASAQLTTQRRQADVEVEISHSTLNYKDAMIVLGQKGVVRDFPITPGSPHAAALPGGRVATSMSVAVVSMVCY